MAKKGRTPKTCVIVASKPPNEWDFLAATVLLVTFVTNVNREETIYEYVESAGSTIWPGRRYHFDSIIECMRQ